MLFDFLSNGTIDTFALPMQKSDARERMFSFSRSLYKVQTRVIQRVNDEHQYRKIWAFFETYDSFVWTAFVIVWLLQWALGVLVHHVEAAMLKRTKPSAAETAWRILRIQLLQPEAFECFTLAGKSSMVLFSLIQCSILLGLYSSWILANIIQHESTTNTQSVKTLLERVQRGEIGLATNEWDSWIFESINNSQAYPYAEFRQVLAKNPPLLTADVNQTLAAVATGRSFTFLQDDDRVNFFSRPHCEFEAIREGMAMVNAHLMFRRGSSLPFRLDDAIRRNHRMLLRFSDKYAELLRKRRDCDHSRTYQPLTIIPFIGLSAVCLTIIAGAVCVLLVEIWIKRRKDGEKH
ncbi:hypothetical protein M3Y99_00667000 [Aphelenchoides fujianensis]|nr:hypothetical protein M3Y99_00667000 [Aphelenchoides fujianensis]